MVQMRHKQTYIIKSIPKSNKTKPRNRIMCLNQLPLFFTSQLTFKRAFVCVSVCVTDRPTDRPTNKYKYHISSRLSTSSFFVVVFIIYVCVFFLLHILCEYIWSNIWYIWYERVCFPIVQRVESQIRIIDYQNNI